MSKSIIVFLTVFLAFTAISCRSTETLPASTHERDSVAFIVKKEYLHDSVYIDRWHTISEKGDTVLQYDSIVEYKYLWRYRHDTVVNNVAVHDTTIVRTEIPVEVTKRVHGFFWWCGLLSCVAVISACCVWVIKHI